jgi:hypothetical protein
MLREYQWGIACTYYWLESLKFLTVTLHPACVDRGGKLQTPLDSDEGLF